MWFYFFIFKFETKLHGFWILIYILLAFSLFTASLGQTWYNNDINHFSISKLLNIIKLKKIFAHIHIF